MNGLKFDRGLKDLLITRIKRSSARGVYVPAFRHRKKESISYDIFCKF